MVERLECTDIGLMGVCACAEDEKFGLPDELFQTVGDSDREVSFDDVSVNLDGAAIFPDLCKRSRMIRRRPNRDVEAAPYEKARYTGICMTEA